MLERKAEFQQVLWATTKAHDEQQERNILTMMPVSPSLLSCQTERESPQSFQAAIKHKQTNQWALRSVQVNVSFSITSLSFSEMILSEVSRAQQTGIQREVNECVFSRWSVPHWLTLLCYRGVRWTHQHCDGKVSELSMQVERERERGRRGKTSSGRRGEVTAGSPNKDWPYIKSQLFCLHERETDVAKQWQQSTRKLSGEIQAIFSD